MPCGDKSAERNWASLPLLLLWMIIDKLDIFDNLCLASVCRDWRSVSSSYPKKQSIGDGMPRIMQVSKYMDSSAHDFVSILRKTKFRIDLPEFGNAKLLYSKQGWLLMRTNTLSRLPDTLFLINPFTKDNIKMPDIADPLKVYDGSFSTRNGFPERVVLLNGRFSGSTTLCMAFIGDSSWTKYIYEGQSMQIDRRCGLITIEEKVYYLNSKENMIIYDMSTQELKELPGPRNEVGYTYIIEHEKRIIKLFFSTRKHTLYSFCRYNDADFSWEAINLEDVKDTGWYLSRKTSCFVAVGKGINVYQLEPKYSGVRHGFWMTYGYDIRSHNLIDGSAQTIELPFRIGSSAKWVDIG